MKQIASRAFPHGGRLLAFACIIVLGTATVTGAAINSGMVPSPVASEIAPATLLIDVPAASKPISPGASISPAASATDALRELTAEHRCLSEVIYFEARGESEQGQRAVAEVIFHRLAGGRHGHTLCAVVYEGAGQAFCQFTFVCDGSRDAPKAAEPWRAAQVLAARLLAGQISTDAETEGATYYHTVTVHPTWAPQKERLIQIGRHIFYRDPKSPLLAAIFRGSLQ